MFESDNTIQRERIATVGVLPKDFAFDVNPCGGPLQETAAAQEAALHRWPCSL